MRCLARLVLVITALGLVAASVLAAPTSIAVPTPSRPVRIACVGDSITFGSRTRIPELDSYPAQLQRMLKVSEYVVRNFGVSGATLLNNGDKPYQQQPAFTEALTFKPQIVVIMLGTNDSKPKNWAHRVDFEAAARELIEKFRTAPEKPKVYVCLPAPVVGEGNFGINEPSMREVRATLDTIARDRGAGLIDVHAALVGHETMLEDRVHPNSDGAQLIARAVYRELFGNDFTGEIDRFHRSEWQGYRKLAFDCAGRYAYVVVPKAAAAGRPWIWRPEFFGVEPQTESALLARGWHAAYVDVRNLYGAPVALEAMDAFYARARQEFELAEKVVLAGFSRGGLFAFNWAGRHPERVAAIYADAPVMDFKSWPGKGRHGSSAADWERCLKAYGFTEEQAFAYQENPLDRLKPLAQAGIPILSVCGDSDHVVPYEENTKIAAARYREFGGTFDVILKPGGDHHPHSLPDPRPIVDFIVRHAERPAAKP